MTLRILHVVSGLQTGGAEAMLLRLASEPGAGSGCDQAVVALSDGPMRQRFGAAGVEIEVLRSLSGVRRAIRARQPDVVQGWMYHGNLFASLAALGNGHAAVLWNIRQSLSDLEREKPVTRVAIRAGAWLSRLPRAIVYNSQLSRAQHECFGFDARRSVYIGNGIDVTRIAPEGARRERVRAAAGATKAFVIGIAARGHPVKAHDVFLRAAAQCVAAIPDLQVWMAGRDLSGNPVIEDLVDQLGIRARVRMTGELGDMAEFYEGLDVCCLSSKAEAFPNVLVEAMAYGVPCVATRVGDVEQVLGEVGASVAVGDSGGMAQAIRGIHGLPEAERLELRRRARARVVGHFDIAGVRQSYRDLYERVCNGTTGGSECAA